MRIRIQYALPVLWLLVTISFIFTHLTNDFFVFWAYGRQVSISGDSGITALLSTWDIKGMLYREYVCHLYSLTNIFTCEFNLLGQAIYKGIAITEMNFFLWLSVMFLPSQYRICQERRTLFFLLSIFYMTVHFSCHLQPEMIALPFLFLSFSLYLHKTWWSLFISVLCLIITFYLKSPLPVMGGTLVAASLLLDEENGKKRKRLLEFIIVFTLIFSLLLIFVNRYYPQEITDILDASHYQRTLLSGGDEPLYMSFAHFLFYFTYSLLYYPILLVSIPFSILLAKQFVFEKKYASLIFEIGVWLFPSVYILISNRYFVYHYDLYIYPAVLIILIYSCKLKGMANLNSSFAIKKMPKLYAIIYVIFISVLSPSVISANKAYNEVYNENISNGFRYGKKIGNGEMLYLDEGTGAFYLGNRTYIRYFYPLPIQRIKEEDTFTKTMTYVNTYNKIMQYSGDYLTLSSKWFFMYPHPEIKEYITTNYEIDNSQTMKTISFSWSLFDIRPYRIGNFRIYKKINRKD